MKTKQKIYVFNVLKVYVADSEEYATELFESDMASKDFNARMDTISIEAVVPQEPIKEADLKNLGKDWVREIFDEGQEEDEEEEE